MENKGHRSSSSSAHVLVVPYPAQGHINPLLQFSKRLASKGLKVTLANTIFLTNSLQLKSTGSVQFETISDGYDDGGFAKAESIDAYLHRMEAVGSKTLADLITRNKTSPDHTPIDCIIYDPFLTWALEVAKKFGLVSAAFFTQTCTVNYTYYFAHRGKLSSDNIPAELRLLEPQDLPSFLSVPGSYPAYLEMMLNQFSNIHKADFVFTNTFYNLEKEVVDSMSSNVSPVLTIGPTIPSTYLDNRIEDDNDYGLHLFKLDDSRVCIEWLNTKPAGSVIYVAFGSMANVSQKQMEELALALKQSRFYFLWVVRASEEAKLPDKFIEETSGKGLIVKWSPQLKVLSNEAVGCFFTHGGWNSTLEALSLGVPMISMPQCFDQPTNAKLVEGIWKVGVRVKLEDNGIVGREEIKGSIRKVMEGETGVEFKRNAEKWSKLAVEAVSDGGTSDNNIRDFISKFTPSALLN